MRTLVPSDVRAAEGTPKLGVFFVVVGKRLGLTQVKMSKTEWMGCGPTLPSQTMGSRISGSFHVRRVVKYVRPYREGPGVLEPMDRSVCLALYACVTRGQSARP